MSALPESSLITRKLSSLWECIHLIRIPFHVFTEVRYTKQPGKASFYTSGEIAVENAIPCITQELFSVKTLKIYSYRNTCKGENFLFPLLGMLLSLPLLYPNNENYLRQHISIFSMLMWKLEANLVLNIKNYIPLFFFHIMFYVF